MTDPVDTDALRHPPWSSMDAIEELLHDAADEVDRLRWTLAASVASEEAATQQVFNLLDERAKLRAVIQSAPHAAACWTDDVSAKRVLQQYRRCTCWKADAL